MIIKKEKYGRKKMENNKVRGGSERDLNYPNLLGALNQQKKIILRRLTFVLVVCVRFY